MADPMARFRTGQRITQNFRGGNVGSGVAKTMVNSRIQLNSAIEKELVTNGWGIKKKPDGNGFDFHSTYDTEEKKMVGLNAYKKGIATADKKLTEQTKNDMALRSIAEKEAFGLINNYLLEGDTDTAQNVFNKYVVDYGQTFGAKAAKKMNFPGMWEKVRWGENPEAVRTAASIKAVWNAHADYIKDNSEKNYSAFLKASSMVSPEAKKKTNLPNPEKTVARVPTKATIARNRAIKKTEAEIKATEKAKPLTRDQLNKRVRDLEQAKLKAQTTKGVDPMDMWLMKGNPKAQEAFKKGDSTALVKEIDDQLKYYRGIREGNKPTAKKTTKKPDKKKTYGILDARKAIDAAGGEMTPDNIKAALEQLNAN